ncbi:MAG: hypothetical protein SGPRY_001303 [Prymnesium sp.]
MPCSLPQAHTSCHALSSPRTAPHATFEEGQAWAHEHEGCPRACTVADWALSNASPPVRWSRLLQGLLAFSSHRLPSAAVASSVWRERSLRRAIGEQWAALVRQRLEEGWRAASACSRRWEGREGQRLLLLDGGAEQMHKNKFVVIDASFIARCLGRVLVEPRVRHSRIAPLNRSSSGRLALHHYWDLQPLCAHSPLLPARHFTRELERRGGAAHFWPKRGRAYAGGWRLHSKSAVQAAFRGSEGARLLVLHDFWRSVRLPDTQVSNKEIEREDSKLPHEGLGLRPSTWELNPGYEAIASSLLAQLGGPANQRTGKSLLAVQWRSEDWEYNDKPRPNEVANYSVVESLSRCALWAARRVRGVMRSHGLRLVFLATDLRPGASGSYIGGERGSVALEALRRFERMVPEARQPYLRGLIDAIPDAGVRSNLEATICAQAGVLLSTTHACQNCKRAKRCSKMGSAFAQYITRRRAVYGRPTFPLF